MEIRDERTYAETVHPVVGRDVMPLGAAGKLVTHVDEPSAARLLVPAKLPVQLASAPSGAWIHRTLDIVGGRFAGYWRCIPCEHHGLKAPAY